MKILAAIDFLDKSDKVIHFAHKISKQMNAELLIVHSDKDEFYYASYNIEKDNSFNIKDKKNEVIKKFSEQIYTSSCSLDEKFKKFKSKGLSKADNLLVENEIEELIDSINKKSKIITKLTCGEIKDSDTLIKFLIDVKRNENLDKLNKIKSILTGDGIKVKCSLVEGNAMDTILKESQKFEADMIVIGSHKHGHFYHMLVGSVRDFLISHSTIPVLIVPPEGE